MARWGGMPPEAMYRLKFLMGMPMPYSPRLRTHLLSVKTMTPQCVAPVTDLRRRGLWQRRSVTPMWWRFSEGVKKIL